MVARRWRFFKQLSETELEWDKVDITLADERWVEEGHDASNTSLVKNNLIQNKAAAARFIELKSDADDANEGVNAAESNLASMSQPFDALILGMGKTVTLHRFSLALSKYLTA